MAFHNEKYLYVAAIKLKLKHVKYVEVKKYAPCVFQTFIAKSLTCVFYSVCHLDSSIKYCTPIITLRYL